MPMIRTRLVSLKNAMKVFTNGGITWRMACSRRREGGVRHIDTIRCRLLRHHASRHGFASRSMEIMNILVRAARELRLRPRPKDPMFPRILFVWTTPVVR